MTKSPDQKTVEMIWINFTEIFLIDASINTKNQYFKKIEVSASSLDKHASTLATYHHLRFLYVQMSRLYD